MEIEHGPQNHDTWPFINQLQNSWLDDLSTYQNLTQTQKIIQPTIYNYFLLVLIDYYNVYSK